jgi:hypothetical protein
MKLYFDDPSFDTQLQRTAAKAPYGCCDLGEVYDELTVDNKQFVMYRNADGGGGGHCEGMGPSRYYTDVFGWLQSLWP